MASELDELKQEMRSAQISAWIMDNRQLLGTIGAILVIAMLAGTLWMERDKAQKEAAATLYYQALAVRDSTKRKALLENIVRDYGRTGYTPLALFQLVSLDESKAQSYLQQLLESNAPVELKWQARLDLAQRLIDEGKRAQAAELLAERVGREYEQLRYYLLSETASDPGSKHDALQKALAAPSHDSDLKERIERLLAEANQKASP